jgi:hypothetical protein
LAHGQVFDLGSDEVLKEKVMQYFHLTIITSVEAKQPWTQTMFYELEGRKEGMVE